MEKLEGRSRIMEKLQNLTDFLLLILDLLNHQLTKEGGEQVS